MIMVLNCDILLRIMLCYAHAKFDQKNQKLCSIRSDQDPQQKFTARSTAEEKQKLKLLLLGTQLRKRSVFQKR